MSSTQKLYRTLHDQLEHALHPAALKTINKILRIDPEDALARSTRVQILLALEQYHAALATDQQSLGTVERAYALYKSTRADEAKRVLEEDSEIDFEQDRAAKVLLAQVDFRLGDFEASRDAFDDLANAVDDDSPELDDLQHNSEQCSARLAFESAVPSLSSGAAARSRLDVEELETRPLTLVLPSQPRTIRQPISTGSSSKLARTTKIASGQDDKESLPKSRSKRPLKRFDPNRTPAEDRWIPKRQRPSMRDQLLQKKEKARGKKRDKVQALTQGSTAGQDEGASAAKANTRQAAAATGSKTGGKKKKGKK
ncbi:hypothetical protein JCM3766R1_000229 [Sporobolomyces carnicolor]